jgi:hypothetical protein
MAYDMQPMLTLVEKQRLLEEAVAGNWRLVFEHDPTTEGGKVIKDGRGKFQLQRL